MSDDYSIVRDSTALIPQLLGAERSRSTPTG